MGAALYAAGWLTDHWSWGRVLPALFFSAQIALAVEAAGQGGRRVRRVLAPLTTVGLVIGCWAQAGSLGYVLRPAAIPPPLSYAPTQPLWTDYAWVRPYLHRGDVVMTAGYFAQRQVPAYGAYTVAPAYPDFFLPDEQQRTVDTLGYFGRGTTRDQRLALLREYHVRWIIQRLHSGGLSRLDPAVREVAIAPTGEVLLRVVAWR